MITSERSPASAPLDVLFVMPRLMYLRFFQPVLDAMIDRGHRVHLLNENARSDPNELEWLRSAERHDNFTSETLDNSRTDPLREARIALRIGMEYVRRRSPVYDDKVAGLPRARLARAPRTIQRLTRIPGAGSRFGRRSLYGSLAAIDRSLPPPADVLSYVARRSPDVLVVCDKGHPGSLTSAYVTAGRMCGIPTALCVASWDNLTNRQRIPDQPHALFVWNERQQREALEFHGVPPERVVMTGAPRFDDWFDWAPSDRTAFLSRVGLDPGRPFVLWVGAALNPAETTEAEYVTRWLSALRRAPDPHLRELGVLIRAHPERFADWSAADFSGFDNVAMWPRGSMSFPIDGSNKADYFDSIYHSRAVIGINSSAMIEASIIGRPVHAVLAPEFHDSQLATFHFSYLLEPDGPVRLAHSMEESFAQLSESIASSEPSEQTLRFVREFVRPKGLDIPATEVFVDEVEALAARIVQPERPARFAGLGARGLLRVAHTTGRVLS